MTSARALTFALLVTATALAGCTADEPTASGDRVTVTTKQGCFVIEFFADDAPETVANFLRYVDERFYDGTVFHRVISGFMIQGGGFRPDGTQKTTHDPIPLEAKLDNTRGTVAMARTNAPDSATSQFFVNVVDNDFLNPKPGTDGYAVFGRVVTGMDIVDKIRTVPTRTFQGMPDWPVEPQAIEKVRRGQDCTEEPPAPAVYGIEVGGIHQTQGEDDAWTVNVAAATDHFPFWFRGTGNRDDKYDVQIEGPAKWEVTASPGTLTIGPTGGSPPYGYAGTGFFTLSLNATTGAADAADRVTIRFMSRADPNVTAEMVLAPSLASEQAEWVATKGDIVTVEYRGFFDDGKTFDQGTLKPSAQFRPVVAGGGLVPGFAYGMLGLAPDEPITVRFPDEVGYGHHQTDEDYVKFNGEWLNFDLKVLEKQ